MIGNGDRIGIALSGGADSVALLHALRSIGVDYGASLSIIHVNHGLRENESDRDELFVRSLAEQLDMVVDCRYVSIPKIRQTARGSIEDIARDERYEYFNQIRYLRGLTKIALGHTLDDQAETVLMKVMRGAGLSGLRGMLPVRDGFYIRPLIETTRAEVIAFLQETRVGHVSDSTNEDERYLRNRVRKKLLPELVQSYNPRLLRNIDHMVDVLRMEEEYLNLKAEELLKEWDVANGADPPVVSVNEFKNIHDALQRRIIRRLIGTVSDAKHNTEYRHVKAVIDFLKGGKSQGVVHVGGDVRVRREYDRLVFERGGNDGRRAEKTTTEEAPQFCYTLQMSAVVAIREISRSIVCEIVDATAVDFTVPERVFMDRATLEFPLRVRNVRLGDTVQPLGMKGTKKIKSMFIDRKIPRCRRSRIPVIEDEKSIVWVAGVCLSERVKVTSSTKKILKAEII